MIVFIKTGKRIYRHPGLLLLFALLLSALLVGCAQPLGPLPDTPTPVSHEGPEPTPELEEVIVEWQRDEESEVCETVQIGMDAVAFGLCAGPLETGSFANSVHEEDLQFYVDTFRSFEASTPAGEIVFHGQGQQAATQAQQRMIAEWAHLVYVGASGRPTGASDGLVVVWHREGGFAGFCNDLEVYVSGEFYAASCQGNQPDDPRRGRLSSEQLEALYAWVDELKSFEYEHTDPATADAMTIRIAFSGRGTQEAEAAQIQAIDSFAAQLYSQAGETGEQSRQTGQDEPGDDQKAARQALEEYFEALSTGSYLDAAGLYGGEYEILSGYNPEIPVEDKAALLQAACRFNGFRCELALREIVHAEQLTPDSFSFVVEFSTQDGSLFEQGPCCGADPDSSPPVSQFVYSVSKIGDQYRVMELPVYTP